MTIGHDDKDQASALPILMRAQMQAEYELAHAPASVPARISIDIRAIYDVLNVLSGFATNGTDCAACSMSNQCARDAIKRLVAASGVREEEARGRS